MSVKLIQDRLERVYQPADRLEEEYALKEITQEIILSALFRAEFFKVASFHGGTCLRIFHGVNRFSEDLDFTLRLPDPGFKWDAYVSQVRLELAAYGYRLEVQDRSSTESAVQGVFLKDDSIGKILLLRHKTGGTPKSLRIKLEIDTHPPAGVQLESRYLDFPATVPIVVHDLPSLFAGKSHALLCRSWEKGRDWYDFLWYVGQKVTPNFELLGHSFRQAGPWKGQDIELTAKWYLEKLRGKVSGTNWETQKEDIRRFLRRKDQEDLAHWSREMFLERVERLGTLIKGSSAP